MRVAVAVLTMCCIAYAVAVTPVKKCPQGRSLEDLKQTVAVGRCKKAMCKLKKGRTIVVEFRFTPDRDVNKLTNTVNAIIVGLPFPFIGVDNTDACDQIYEAGGKTKVGCPLKAGKEYVYKNQFNVLDIYPNLRLVVHWGLTAEDGKDVMCFHLPARIAN